MRKGAYGRVEKQSFFRGLAPRTRYTVGNLFFLYLIQGVYVIMIGSILPAMKAEYGLDYRIGGFLISAHSIGNMATGLLAGLLPLVIGLKRSLLALNVLPFLGFAVTLFTGNPLALIFALLLTGIGRGAVSNYNNQIVSTLSGGSAAEADSAQLLTSLLWVAILAGRFACGALSGRVAPPRMIRALCGGMVLFLVVLLASASVVPMLLGTIGLGLTLSGMYGTTVANAGDVFSRYPLAMGVFVTVTSLGSVVTPSVIGGIAASAGIRMGMAVLLIPAMAALALALWNCRLYRNGSQAAEQKNL